MIGATAKKKRQKQRRMDLTGCGLGHSVFPNLQNKLKPLRNLRYGLPPKNTLLLSPKTRVGLRFLREPENQPTTIPNTKRLHLLLQPRSRRCRQRIRPIRVLRRCPTPASSLSV
jgi:hypothetical protein